MRVFVIFISQHERFKQYESECRVNRYSSGVTSYFVSQIKTFSDLPYGFVIRNPMCVAHDKKIPGFTLLLRVYTR